MVLAVGSLATAAIAAVQGGLPAISPAIQDTFDLSLVEVTAVFTAFALGTVLTLLAWGVLSDRRGERAVISGAGQSEVGRRLYRDPLDLTLDACLAAIDDAGLTPADIDGIATYPGVMDNPPGFSGAGVVDVQDALRLDLSWYTGGIELPGQLGSVIDAVMAVACDLATMQSRQCR